MMKAKYLLINFPAGEAPVSALQSQTAELYRPKERQAA